MCTAAAVSSMVSGVVVGVLALGERLPATAPARAARLASWLLVLAGVAGLAAGSGVAELLAPPPFPPSPPGYLTHLLKHNVISGQAVCCAFCDACVCFSCSKICYFRRRAASFGSAA